MKHPYDPNQPVSTAKWSEVEPMQHVRMPLRARIGVRLLRPWLVPMIEKATHDLRQLEDGDHDTRLGGYRQGVSSALKAVYGLRDRPR